MTSRSSSINSSVSQLPVAPLKRIPRVEVDDQLLGAAGAGLGGASGRDEADGAEHAA